MAVIDGTAAAAPQRSPTSRTVVVLARRSFLDARARTVAFAYVFAVYAWLQVAGYKSAYPTIADRTAFAASFAGNDAIRLFYGYPYNVITIGGYGAWRVGGTLAIAAAAFGVLAAVRAMRAEEESGRAELVLAGPLRRRTTFVSAVVAIGAGTAALWAAECIGFIAGRLPVAGSAYLAVATASVVPVFTGAGAVVSQLAATRRGALGLGSAFIALCWLLRVLADTSAAGAWLRWATPLGWAEELRPFTGARPLVLLLPAAATAALLVVAAHISTTRDVGTGILPARDTASPRLALLSSPSRQAVRAERGSFVVWALCVAASAAVLGMVSTSISSAGISQKLQRNIGKLGAGPITTPSGYLAFVFIVFILAVCVFGCGQVGAVREEEAEGRTGTLFALPVDRSRWLGARLLIAVIGAAVLSALAGLFTWAGAASQGVTISLPRMLEAGANCLPVSLLFLGVASLAYACAPRASAAISYGAVSLAFIWYLVGSLSGVPKWATDLTPFAHIGLVPSQHFQPVAALAMVGVGLACAMAALAGFRRRDVPAS